MSFAVLHMQKLKMGSMKGIENHNERLKESKTNPDIDYSKSHQNIDFHRSDDRTYYMRVKDRIQELDLPKAVRKDAVVAVGFVATSDKAFFDNLSPEQTKKFFEVTNDFLKDRYGEKNVIASKLHLDERTPHLHTYIVPVTDDGRLSAKSVFTKQELTSLQADYHKHMNDNGFPMEKGQGIRQHIEMAEFKKQTAFNELTETEKQLKVISGKKAETETELNSLKSDLNALKSDLNKYNNLKVDFERIDSINAKSKLLSKDKVVVDAEQFEYLKSAVKKIPVLESKIELLESQNISYSNDFHKLHGMWEDLKEKNLKKQQKMSSKDKELDYTKDYLDQKGLLEEAQKFIQEKKAMEQSIKPKSLSVKDLEI
ncbi:hypothetical protein J2Z35_002888 [Acetoanaerobium pronyense]|uniref:Plasmid recombination enzyme n=1 Tax=Acetoanaerobium pronyense TaxID=1482736 RepID=A0ABS4KMQ0_9FIRM|nr:MobV family relaxase [Acetoanaerobium pronyense]MBP2029050.1 hypothetical protein [Acetoanaerobium pronyense]